MNATTATVEERVRRGALLLDAEAPGWAWRINETELDLGSCEACILGQVYGGFIDGLNSVQSVPLWDDFDTYGFDSCEADGQDDEAVDQEYTALAVAWLAEIRLRLIPGDDDAEPMMAHANCPASVLDVP